MTDLMFLPRLLEELKNFNVPNDYRIRRVYRKCIKFKHFTWAVGIIDKYPHVIRNSSDDVMALAMPIEANKKQEDGK